MEAQSHRRDQRRWDEWPSFAAWLLHAHVNPGQRFAPSGFTSTLTRGPSRMRQQRVGAVLRSMQVVPSLPEVAGHGSALSLPCMYLGH